MEENYVNHGVSQGCNNIQYCLIAILLTIVREWKLRVIPGIKINDRIYLNAIVFAEGKTMNAISRNQYFSYKKSV